MSTPVASSSIHSRDSSQLPPVNGPRLRASALGGHRYVLRLRTLAAQVDALVGDGPPSDRMMRGSELHHAFELAAKDGIQPQDVLTSQYGQNWAPDALAAVDTSWLFDRRRPHVVERRMTRRIACNDGCEWELSGMIDALSGTAIIDYKARFSPRVRPSEYAFSPQAGAYLSLWPEAEMLVFRVLTCETDPDGRFRVSDVQDVPVYRNAETMERCDNLFRSHVDWLRSLARRGLIEIDEQGGPLRRGPLDPAGLAGDKADLITVLPPPAPVLHLGPAPVAGR